MGRVHFVGAGPGDPELLTRKAARLLAQADVVLHDALVQPAVLALAPQARLIDVGKRACRPSTAQRFINRALVAAARSHECVVRLKGGDPAIFGRLDEEIGALRAAGLEFDVVPGITTASAAAAELGTSLTLRGVARAVTLLTPRVAEGLEPSDWARAARGDTTLVVYMAGRQIAATASALVAQGLPAGTPIAIQESVSLPDARLWIGTLHEAATQALAPAGGPVILTIGEALRGALEVRAAEAVPTAVGVAQARVA
jgi:uroporphyrin-III C-methyltransferase